MFVRFVHIDELTLVVIARWYSLHKSTEIYPLLVDIWNVSSLELLGENAALNLLELVSWCIYASKRLSWAWTQECGGCKGHGQGLSRSRSIVFPESPPHTKASVNPFFHTWHYAALFVLFYRNHISSRNALFCDFCLFFSVVLFF